MSVHRRGRLAAVALTAALLFMVGATIGPVIGFGNANAQEAATASQNTQEKARTETAPSKDGPARSDVRVAIKVYNQDGGILIEARKRVPAKSNAFDILRGMINVEYTTFANLGVFVTGLAGVKPPAGQFWILYVDGKPSELGISNITITEDTRIEWKIEQPKPH
jgi:Domain of unknown function (DUF4430)